MADVTVLGFHDSSHGTMRTAPLGPGLVLNVWDITGQGDCSSSVSLPTTLSKVIFATGWADATALDVSMQPRHITSYSLCSGGPYVCFSISEYTTGSEFSSTYFHALAIGW